MENVIIASFLHYFSKLFLSDRKDFILLRPQMRTGVCKWLVFHILLIIKSFSVFIFEM